MSSRNNGHISFSAAVSLGVHLCLFRFHLQGKLGINVSAVVASAMGQLGISALRTTHVMNGRQGVMRAAFALTRLTVFLDRLHEATPARSPSRYWPERRRILISNQIPTKSNGGQLYPPIQRGATL
jgi:hypothetical protein